MNTNPPFEEEIDLSDYWRVLKRRKWTVFSVFSGTVLAVAVASLLMTPVYRATVVLLVDQEDSNVLTISGNDMALATQNYAAYKEYFQSQKEIIQSRSILEQVFKEFKLNRLEDYSEGRSSRSGTSWSAQARTFMNSLVETVTGQAAPQPRVYSNQPDPVEKFMEDVKVEEVRGTRLLKLNVENKDPELAAQLANRIAEVYVERNLAYISKSEILTLQKNEYLKLKATLNEYSKIYKEKHPKLIRVKQKLADITEKIRQESAVGFSMDNAAIPATDLASLKASNVSVQDWAQAVYKPVKPKKRRNLLLAIILGLFGAVGLAFFLEYLDHSVKNIEDIRHLIEWPFLGYIPVIRRSKENLDVWIRLEPVSPAAEAYRTIRTNLLFSSTQERPVKSLLLTSPGQQEGKSVTVSNLAIAMAQTGRRVLLVDADMRRPRQHKIYQTANKRGLSSFLAAQTPFEETLHPTAVENLCLVPCGPCPPNPSELLAGKKMDEFMVCAESRFDFILFDTPPVMVVTDALLLSKKVDGTVLVLESGKTSRKVIPLLRQSLENAQARVVGLLMNKVKAQDDNYGGYYYARARYYGAVTQ
ncbi:MAG: polysaccharide biosynthesis tyrosine autokinase [Candidatus Omnitrophica bacterium]|nr:polysaccharide biosynthesis tyrosine autokinase [Candidatus Omnitrophota bacterium]